MSTDLEIPGSEPTNPDLFPRRSLRRGVARMVRSTTTPLLILAGIALCTSEATAGSVVYSMVDYPSLQNGYSVGGTITATNGSISAWDITLSLGTDPLYTFDTINSTFFSNNSPVVTPTTIYAPSNSFVIVDANDFTFALGWDPVALRYYGVNERNGFWNTSIPNQDFTIATLCSSTVPEPSSCLLAVCGVVSGIAYAESKRRAKRRRPGGGQS